jgi:hypothetical protein
MYVLFTNTSSMSNEVPNLNTFSLSICWVFLLVNLYLSLKGQPHFFFHVPLVHEKKNLKFLISPGRGYVISFIKMEETRNSSHWESRNVAMWVTVS